MEKKFLIPVIFLVVFLVTIGWFFSRNNTTLFPMASNQAGELKINGEKVAVEIAATPEKRELGLSGRDSLCADCGMLFVFEKPDEYPFWMKDMRFDLDMVWISGDRVVDISKNVSHVLGTGEVVTPKALIDKVLELNAGMADKLGLKIGDTLGL